MKNANKFVGLIAIAIIAIAIIGCKQDDSPADTPKVQPATPRTLSFGTNCKVTITSTDTFTTAEWNTLCDKVVSAIGRGYGSGGSAMKSNIEIYFMNNNVSVVLSKSATYDCEVKSGEVSIMYLKANASTIDGLIGENLLAVIMAMMADEGSYHHP
jgi:hypothetical protein